MPQSVSSDPAGTILLIGASRGLGHAMAAEFLKKGWKIVGTVRAGKRTLLHDLADAYQGRVEIELLDITEPDLLAALRDRLPGISRLSRPHGALVKSRLRWPAR
jgi:NAD(P)-dependent dehydrogenase (short-subunit alcohol dehydrogenase family)